jgi:hypothetical protein
LVDWLVREDLPTLQQAFPANKGNSLDPEAGTGPLVLGDKNPRFRVADSEDGLTGIRLFGYAAARAHVAWKQRRAELHFTGELGMDATRARRTRDNARQRWYALCRARRFARHLGFFLSRLVSPKK